MLRLPHFVDSHLTDGSEVVSLVQQPAALYPQEDSCCSFLLEAESDPKAIVQLEGLGSY
jgi:hypothetical protein